MRILAVAIVLALSTAPIASVARGHSGSHHSSHSRSSSSHRNAYPIAGEHDAKGRQVFRTRK